MHRIPYAKTMACGIWIKQGSKYESDSNSGLSHLLEHLMINIENKNNPKYQKLINELSYEGVIYNAGTTKESTSFYFSGLSRNLEKCIQALASIVIDNRNFSDELIENEKKVVIQEAISFYSSFNQIKERTSQALYGNMDIGRIIVGSIDRIKCATNKDLGKIVDESYTPENSTLVIVGGIDYEKTLKIIDQNFSSWADRETRKYKETIEGEPGIFFNSINNGQNSVVSIGFRIPSYIDKDRVNIEIISKILAEPSLESRLVQEIRMKRGLAYNLGGFTSFYENRGTLGFTVICAHKSVNEVIKVIMYELNKAKEKGVSDEEVSRAKKIMETRTLLDLDNLLAQLKFLGKCSSYGQLFSLENEVRKIQNVLKENINPIICELFNESNMGFAAIGSFDIDETIQYLKIN